MFPLVGKAQITGNDVGIEQVSSRTRELLTPDNFFCSRGDSEKIFLIGIVAPGLLINIEEQAKAANGHGPHFGYVVVFYAPLIVKQFFFFKRIRVNPLEILNTRFP